MQITKNLKKYYSHMFDFYDDYTIGQWQFNLYARFYQENLRYFGSKKLEIYSFNNNEHLFVKEIENNNCDVIFKTKDFFDYCYNNLVEVDDKHMSTVITLIYVVSNVDDETKKFISKFKFDKSYAFGFKGWVKGKLIVIDRNDYSAYENKLAKGDAVKLKIVS